MKPRADRKKLERGIWSRVNSEGKTVYGITFTDPTGRTVRKKVGPSITVAREALKSIQTDMARGEYRLVPAKRSSPLFKTFAVQYLEHAQTEKRSWKLDRECLKPLIRHFGNKPLDRITPWSIEQYKAKRLETVSGRTVNIELSILRRLFRVARTWKKVDGDPVVEVKRLREDEKPIRVLSPEEEKRLLAASPPHLRDLIVLALNTGLRLGELRALSKDSVNLSVGTLTVAQSKTGKVRHVPLNAAARAVVERGLAAGHRTILHYHGKPIANIHRTWYRVTKDAKVEGFRIHDLRHTFATRMVLGGTDLATVAALLGHSSIIMTQRYAHPSPSSKRAAVTSLDAFSAHLLPTTKRK